MPQASRGAYQVDIDGRKYNINGDANTTTDDIDATVRAIKASPDHKNYLGRQLFDSLQTADLRKRLPEANDQAIQLALSDSRHGMSAEKVDARANLRTNADAGVAARSAVDSPLSALRFGMSAIGDTATRGTLGAFGYNADELPGQSYQSKTGDVLGLHALGKRTGVSGVAGRLLEGLGSPDSLAMMGSGTALRALGTGLDTLANSARLGTAIEGGSGLASGIRSAAQVGSAGAGIAEGLAHTTNLGMQGADFVGSLPYAISDPARFVESNLLNAVQAGGAIHGRLNPKFEMERTSRGLENDPALAQMEGRNIQQEVLTQYAKAHQQKMQSEAMNSPLGIVAPNERVIPGSDPTRVDPTSYTQPRNYFDENGSIISPEQHARQKAEREVDNYVSVKAQKRAAKENPLIAEPTVAQGIAERLTTPEPLPTHQVIAERLAPKVPDDIQALIEQLGAKDAAHQQTPPPVGDSYPVSKVPALKIVDGGESHPLTPVVERLKGKSGLDYYTRAADMFAEAKKDNPNLTREDFGKQLLEMGQDSRWNLEGATGNIKEKDVFTIHHENGRVDRIAGVEDASVPNPPRMKLQSGFDPTFGKFDESGKPLIDTTNTFRSLKERNRANKKDTPYEPSGSDVIVPSVEEILAPVTATGGKTSVAPRHQNAPTANAVRTNNSVAEHELLGGQVINRGSLEGKVNNETDAGRVGKEADASIRGAQESYQKGKYAVQDRVAQTDGFIDSQNKLIKAAAKESGVSTADTSKEFIRRIEMKRNDPARLEGASKSLQEAIREHDTHMEDWRQYIIKNPIGGNVISRQKPYTTDTWQVMEGDKVVSEYKSNLEAKQEAAKLQGSQKLSSQFGITDKGYFPRQSEGRYILKDGGDKFVGRFKSPKDANRYMTENPSPRGYKPVELEQDGDFFSNYIAERKNTGALMKREGTAQAYEKSDYAGVMRNYARRVSQAVEISKIKRTAEPLLTHLEENDLGGVADAMRRNIDDIAGKTSDTEQRMSDWIQRQRWGDKVEAPQFALRQFVSNINAINSAMKLAGVPKNFITNALQPLSTLFPYVKATEFAKAYQFATSKEGRQVFAERRIGSDAPKNLELESDLAGRIKGPLKDVGKYNFQSIGSAFSAQVGYSHGYLRFLDAAKTIKEGGEVRGVSAESAAKIKAMSDTEIKQVAHENGQAWKEKVEYDSSAWNAPPFLRGWAARGLFQYKSYMVKNIEEFANYGRRREGQTKAEFTGQVAKGIGTRAVLSGSKGFLAGKPIAMALAGIVSMMNPNMSDEEKIKVTENMYLGFGNYLQSDMSSSFGLLDQFYGANVGERILRFGSGPTGGTLIDLAQLIDSLPETDAQRQKRETDWNYEGKSAASKVGDFAKTLTPFPKMAEAISQIGKDNPIVSDKAGRQTQITPVENLWRSLGFTPASIVKSKTFKHPPTIDQLLSGR